MTYFLMPFKRVQRLIPRGNGAQSRLINWDHLKYICGWIDQSNSYPIDKLPYRFEFDIEVINFGNGDLRLDCNFNESFSCSARKNSYEFNIRDDSSSFCVESFEVFKIINRNE
ncbi:7287_t:CDS:2 [Rhizophagus irregularis]|nr:7287_t:CDS:2 [Rhizophagus irregularis]